MSSAGSQGGGEFEQLHGRRGCCTPALIVDATRCEFPSHHTLYAPGSQDGELPAGPDLNLLNKDFIMFFGKFRTC